MSQSSFVPVHEIRAAFSAAMSKMYKDEVPTYGTLMDIVTEINEAELTSNPTLKHSMESTDQLNRLSEERHGAIRLGKASELAMMRRIFAIMGMEPVGYYDLSTAGIPVHSTAFRPVTDEALAKNPFRIFTSLLRLDLIADQSLRSAAEAVIKTRDIFTDGVKELVKKAEKQGGLTQNDANWFIEEALETFRWHSYASVSSTLYKELHDAHRLIADVVSFKGPHINHLTPNTLDIDKAQAEMPRRAIEPKAVVEGPPRRACPILLRQTSFKALNENVTFKEEDGRWHEGHHTARFGEIEQRGCALTPKGRALYDNLLLKARSVTAPNPDGSNAADYIKALQDAFSAFPDTYQNLRSEQLAFFRYSLTEKGKDAVHSHGEDATIDDLIEAGLVRFDPLTYEDFLPVSAAGIFQSNLGDTAAQGFKESPNQALFEEQLGAPVISEFALYAETEARSLHDCIHTLRAVRAA